MAYKKALRTLGTEDEVSSRFQENVSQALEPLLRFPISDGVLLKDVQLSGSGAQNLAHKLGRDFRGWLIVRKNANASIWEGTATQRNRFLPLQSSAAVTVDVWVF